MTEIIFLVEDAPEGGYTARALGESIFTEADDLEGLERNVRDAVAGTLAAILDDVAGHLKTTRAQLLERLA
jgi:hypothetical protein